MVDVLPPKTGTETKGTVQKVTAPQRGRTNPEWQAKDRRDAIPVLGFKEYWYPALTLDMVGKKPRPWRMLGEDVVFFRGKNKGEVGCISSICPHRGGNIAEGECHWPGTVTCPYHGWTFDAQGKLLAVLSEGPNSLIPKTGVTARPYPTKVLKGMVFVWMGEREPAPIEEDVPPEFFDDKAWVRYHIDYWPCNWRRSVENAADAHASYVHRNSIRSGKNSHMFTSPTSSRYEIVNGRYALMLGLPPGAPRAVSGKVKQHFPELGHHWPKSQWRKAWTWAFDWNSRRVRSMKGMSHVREWSGVGQHLPSYVRRDENAFVYTRCSVPIDEELTREVYYHWGKASNWIGRVYAALHWHLFGNWSFNINFSQQDLKAVNNQRYDTDENFGPNDMTLVWWRRLCTMARDLHPEGVAQIEGASSAVQKQVQQKPAPTNPY
jgi:phenylpropionate dioxygenase-like ring-hydroxylating dioxygenase large terminal subunit